MKRISTAMLFVAALVLMVAPVAQADFVNGSFEAGTTGWSGAGDAWVIGSMGGGPTDGVLQAGMTTGVFGAPASDVALGAALGLGPNAFDNFWGVDVIEGSLIYQPITITAGEIITFDWNMPTNEFLCVECEENDFSFVALVGTPNVGVVLADVLTGTFIPTGGGPFADMTGYGSFSGVVPFSGSFLFAVGVVDVGDGDFDSGLLVDNFQIIPAPGAFLLGALGLGLVGWIRKRFV